MSRASSEPPSSSKTPAACSRSGTRGSSFVTISRNICRGLRKARAWASARTRHSSTSVSREPCSVTSTGRATSSRAFWRPSPSRFTLGRLPAGTEKERNRPVRSVIEFNEHENGPIEIDGTDAQLVFTNESGVPRPPAELLAVLRASTNREGVKSLVVRGSSQLSDLQVLNAFPNVAFLRILGLKVLTLDGVETLTGSTLAVVVDTDKNKKRTIAALSQTRTHSLELGHTQPSDLRTAMLLGNLKQLTAGECETLPTEAPWEAPVESLSLKNGRFTKLANLTRIRGLTQ